MNEPAPRTPLLEAESEVVRALAGAATVGEAAHDVLATLGRVFGWDVALLWLPDDASGLLRCSGAWTSGAPGPDEYRGVSERLTFAPGVGLPGRVWASGEPYWIADVTRDPWFPRAELAVRGNLASAAAFPIRSPEAVLGVVEVLGSDRREPAAGELDALAIVGRQLAYFVAHVRTEEWLRESEARIAAIFDAALDSLVTMDAGGRILDFNPAAEATFGYAREDAAGRPLADLIVPPELRAAHRAGLERYIETREAKILDRRLELEAMRADGSRLPVELTITRLGRREPPVFAGFIRDITPRRDAEAERRHLVREAVASRASEEAARVRAEAAQAQAERERARMAFLARAGLRLASSMDYEATLDAVARVAVPEIADACGVAVAGPDGRLRTIAAPAADLGDPADWPGVPDAIRTGEPQLLTEVPDARPGLRSALTVPIAAPGRTLGAITLVFGASGRHYDDDDVVVARSLAARAGLHIENARLYTEQAKIADTLQDSLLPAALPPIPGIEVAARYRAAGEQNQVGGDFYDVFRSGDGAWTAIIGDVSGKGAAAAALTALARHTLYAAAVRDESPARNLAFLNEVMRSRSPGAAAFCTVVCARVQPTPDGATVTLASGGHPPPLVLRASGSPERIEAPGTLVGVLAEATFEQREVPLGPGDVLLLYTDGATELRRRDLGFGERELQRVLGECAGFTADAVVESALRRVRELQEGTPADDVALLALRVTPGGEGNDGRG